MPHFNKLTPAEAERLALLLEECSEVQQIIGKILRHGYESWNPNDCRLTNRQLLEREIGDLHVAGELLIRAGDVNQTAIEAAVQHKETRLPQYLHHQRAVPGEQP